jgi:hypothetical protein
MSGVSARETNRNSRPGALVLAVREGQLARENLIRRASQIRLSLRVGVRLNFGPVDVTEYTKAEIKAAVVDAESCGTCVTVHG